MSLQLNQQTAQTKMITLNIYLLLFIIGITAISLFLNIYSTIKMNYFIIDDTTIEQLHRQIEELHVDNMHLQQKLTHLNKIKEQYEKECQEAYDKIKGVQL